MNIVIPTYEHHFRYNFNFLESFDTYCLDKKNVNIYIIGRNASRDYLNTWFKQFSNLNIFVYTLSDLIYNVDGITIDDTDDNYFTVKYQLQSLKKLLAYTVTNGDYIVMDSENLCLKPFYFSDIFSSQKNKKLIYCKRIHTEDNTLGISLMKNSNSMLNTNDSNWYFIKSYWFFEYDYVKLLVDELKKFGTLYLYLQDKIFFEYQLYCMFLYKNNIKEFEEIDNINNEEYNFNELLKKGGRLGPGFDAEYICTVLNIDNVKYYCNILNKMDERIVRLHWMDEITKNYIIENTNICIGTFHFG